jgi:protein phosphatase
MIVDGLSHVGNVRTSNEDAMTWDPEIGFAAVADGMGGHQAGEVASRLALDALHSFLRKSAESDDFTWPFGINPQRSLTANRLITALKIANRRIFKRSEEVSDYLGMGTTVVAVLVEHARVTFASVGDSRIYVLSDGELRQLTRDDTWLVLLSQEPGVTAETLKTHPMRNVLTNVVGAKPEIDTDVHELTLGAGQTLLLTTDGLHNALPPELMASIIAEQPDLKGAAGALVRAALERDGKDNITAVLVRAGSS